ncbi:hypothetical protein [Opitutus sp. GAS368]|uniref:hypothetical protein n=1 Tax=Opitutus sp. GAS368 TaxID=1882749 RepID=UPI0012FE2D8E|nr:hypothetical protein [Opitutus sp. GAS368]
MSLLAENLVEEWMNRQGFFTIRGVRDGVAEIDLLGVRTKKGSIEAWHIESQVSFNPVSYVTPLTNERAKKIGKARTTAWKRSPEIISESVTAWIEKKFNSTAKTKVRERLWPGLKWQKKLVYGVVRHSEEVSELEKHIALVPFYEVLRDLCWNEHELFSATGTDIANIVEYYEDCAAVRQRGKSRK